MQLIKNSELRLKTKLESYLNQFSWVPKPQRVLVFSLVGLGLISLIVLIFSGQKQDKVNTASIASVNNAQIVSISEEIGKVRTDLQTLLTSSVSSGGQQVLERLDGEVSGFGKEIQSLAKTADVHEIAVSLDNRLGELEKKIASGNSKTYLNANSLPFKIVSVDVIANQAYVAVDYHNQIVPLGIGDSLAGWKVTNADYGEFEVEFESVDGAFVQTYASNRDESENYMVATR